jgi:hypothetical protein
MTKNDFRPYNLIYYSISRDVLNKLIENRSTKTFFNTHTIDFARKHTIYMDLLIGR